MFLKERVGDFETASGCNLKKAGAARYAEDPTTEILCFSWGPPGEKARTWFPDMGPQHPITLALMDDAFDTMVTWIAHNALFEKSIWRCIMVLVFGFPDIPDQRWHDTMASCAMKVIPQQLEQALKVLHIPAEKDMEGSRLTIGLSKPNRKTGMLDRSPDTLARVGEYCEQDVLTEGLLHKRIGWLSPSERRVWLLDQEINERGVMLDMGLIRAAKEIVAKASKPLLYEFSELTGGLGINQAVKIGEWARSRGVVLPNMQKQTLIDLLGIDEDGEEPDFDPGALEQELPSDVERALRIRQLVGSASVKKLDAMLACVCSDGAAHNLLQYYGAGTGRWAGRLLQPQNFPRGSLGENHNVDALVAGIMSEDPEFLSLLSGAPPVETVVSSLRHMLISRPGRVFVSGDFMQIEARVVLALAGQQDKVQLLASGASPYIDMGWKIFGRKIDKHNEVAEYTISKNSVLGLGFQMGAPKFHDRYAKTHPMSFCEEIVRIYREDWAPMVPKLWYGLERAAVATVHSGTPHEAYGVRYALEDGWLTARLPNGRKLWYYNPLPTYRSMPWDPLDVRPGFSYQAKKTGRWITIDAYGGLLTENVVQALARDLLVSAMFRCQLHNIPMVLTVHDEIVGEPRQSELDEKAMGQILADSPPWALELKIPVAADTWAGDRYRK